MWLWEIKIPLISNIAEGVTPLYKDLLTECKLISKEIAPAPSN